MRHLRGPEVRRIERFHLRGTMCVYTSQEETTEQIPLQWRTLLQKSSLTYADARRVFGASPDAADGRIHYLCGVQDAENVEGPDTLTVEAGEYAVFAVEDLSMLRPAWVWILKEWLPQSGYRERRVPEFECFRLASDARNVSAPVELWVPIEPNHAA